MPPIAPVLAAFSFASAGAVVSIIRFCARVAAAAPVLALACALGSSQAARADGNAGAALDQQEALRVSQAAIGRTPRDYAFTDRSGRALRLSQLRGKPLLVSFVYTGCFQVCPVTTKFLAEAVTKAQGALGSDSFNILTIGFNQPFDSPDAMREFAVKQGALRPNWEFASPAPQDVKSLTEDFGFVYAASAGGFDHLTQVTVLDAQGRIAAQIYGETFELQMLVEPMKTLLAGESVPVRGVSGWIEQVRILCTVYDPASGRYRLNYSLFIEIGAGLSVIGSVVYYLLAERRRRRKVEMV